jgi:hypothetical protein
MAAISVYVNAPIDVDSARMCKAEAIAFMRERPTLPTTKRETMQEYIHACEDVTAGRALFDDAFPHGAESTFLWLAYGKSV